jgi:hypothetical protein
LKQALSSEPVLACFSMDKPIFVITDASPVGLEAILLQQQDDEEKKPVAYISKTLSEVDRRYSQIEREALAIREVKIPRFRFTGTSIAILFTNFC